MPQKEKSTIIYDSDNENDFNDNWNDLLYQIDKEVENNIVIAATIRRYNGTFPQYVIRHDNNIKNAIKSLNMFDHAEISVNDGELIVNASHHDGTNTYKIRSFKTDKIADIKTDKGFKTEDDLIKSTVPIGDYVLKILGFE